VRRRRRLVVIVTIAALGCASHRLRTRTAPTPAWRADFAYAQQAVALGRYGQADSALLAFSIAHPGTHDAAESEFWRALFALDPRNDHHSAADAIRALTAYASSPEPRDHDLEAEVLRRTATALTALSEATAQAASQADSARTEADSVRTEADSARLARASRDRTREEVQRLRDSLDKVDSELTETNQELDRIKKRLAAPKP
jgi:TolA-binding protein